jgi:endonuclease YncB( thermonuclease family)
MKKLLIIALLALLMPMLAMASPNEAVGKVTNVVDGDTFDVQLQSHDSRIAIDNIMVRLADVDSPELGMSDGDQAKDYAYQWLQDRRVYLDLDDKTGKHQYGRWVAVVYLAMPDGSQDITQNSNRMLVDSGHTCVWDFSDNEFTPADWWGGSIPATACIKSESSISQPTAISPSPSSKSGQFVGFVKSNKYHYSSCQ